MRLPYQRQLPMKRWAWGDPSQREENDPVAPLPTFRKRVQVLSDLTGMNLAELAGSRAPRADRLTVSELTVLLNMDPEAVVRQHTRRRQKSSSDVITKFAQANALKGDDLRLAEEVEKYGTITERKELGRTEEASVGSIEQHEGLEPPDDFVYNHVGLTSVQVRLQLMIYTEMTCSIGIVLAQSSFVAIPAPRLLLFSKSTVPMNYRKRLSPSG